MDETAVVMVYDDDKGNFVRTVAGNVRCPECGREYDDKDDIWWDFNSSCGYFLQCECGEQFLQAED